jgi:ubiquinone/menaquinone biosynthesis C-methylase UbiE
MTGSFEKLQEVWSALGREDPLWAVYSDPNKRGGKWDPTEFYATGERDVSHFHAILKGKANCSERLQHVLDFGCGVGRVSAAWARRAEKVTGIDISKPMIEYGANHLQPVQNLDFVHNPREDLRVLKDDAYDLVFSLICLQHIPWELAKQYVREFARIVRPGALVAFQLPTEARAISRLTQLRKYWVDALPFGLSQVYRKWRHGSSTAFDTFYTPANDVENCAVDAGLKLVAQEPDNSCGEGTTGYFYIFRKPTRAIADSA